MDSANPFCDRIVGIDCTVPVVGGTEVQYLNLDNGPPGSLVRVRR